MTGKICVMCETEITLSEDVGFCLEVGDYLRNGTLMENKMHKATDSAQVPCRYNIWANFTHEDDLDILLVEEKMNEEIW